MQSTETKIYKKICGNGMGWVFSAGDFSSFGNINAIRVSLMRLEKAGKILRICRGLYYYPEYSTFLKKHLSPGIDRIAQAMARKFRWRIQPTGGVALNLLGLSTQVPARPIYLSDGPNRTYNAGEQVIKFRKTNFKEADLKNYRSGLLVQALKTLGQNRITDEVIDKIRRQLSSSDRRAILADTKHVTSWIYDIIRRICAEEGR